MTPHCFHSRHQSVREMVRGRKGLTLDSPSPRPRRLLSSLFLGLVLLAGFNEKALAADESSGSEKKFLPWERGFVKFGGFVSAFDSTLAFGVDRGAGVSFNAEDLFGLETSLTVFRAEAMYRPGKSLRHQMDFTYARRVSVDSPAVSQRWH